MPLETKPGDTDIIYNIEAMAVAALLDEQLGTYGSPAFVRYGGDMSWEYAADTNDLKAYGMVVETLTVPTHATGSLNRGAVDFPVMSIMTGMASESSSGANYVQWDPTVGGEGTAYFGLIAKFAAKNGKKMVCGHAKMKLETIPAFSIAQNEFRMDETAFKTLAPSTTLRKFVRYRAYTSYGDLPDNANDFGAFFEGCFDGA